MNYNLLKKVPYNQQAVLENVATIHGSGGNESLKLVTDARFLKESDHNNIDFSVAPNTNQQKVYSSLSQQNIFNLRLVNSNSIQPKLEVIPLPFLNNGQRQGTVPCARVYIANQRGDKWLTATDLEGSQGYAKMDILDTEFDTPMAQWWLIPAELAFPSYPNLAGAFVIRSFAGNGMFLAAAQPCLRRYGTADSRLSDRIDIWRISRCALSSQNIRSESVQYTSHINTNHASPYNNNITTTYNGSSANKNGLPVPQQNYDYENKSNDLFTAPQVTNKYIFSKDPLMKPKTNVTQGYQPNGHYYGNQFQSTPTIHTAYSYTGVVQQLDKPRPQFTPLYRPPSIKPPPPKEAPLFFPDPQTKKAHLNLSLTQNKPEYKSPIIEAHTTYQQNTSYTPPAQTTVTHHVVQAVVQPVVTQQTVEPPVVTQTVDLKEQARQQAPPFWGVTLNAETAQVQEMWHDGPGYKAGIRPNDQIVRVAGVDVSNYDETLAQMKKTRVGEQNTITVKKPNGSLEQLVMTPMTNRPEYKNEHDIYYDTNQHYKIPLKNEATQQKIDHAAAQAPPFWGVTLDSQTAQVQQLWKDGPAYRAGLRPGDQIVSVSGVEVSNYEETLAQMKKTKVGESNTITVKKPDGSREQHTMIPLTNRPEYADVQEIYYDTSATTKNYKIPAQGTTPPPAATGVLDHAAKQRKIEQAAAQAPPFWGVTLDSQTAQVQQLWKDGPAYRAGLRPGDQIVSVSGVGVSNYEETLAEMKKTKVNQANTITVKKPDGSRGQHNMIPLTNRPEYADVPEIYYDTSATTKNHKIPN